VSYNELKRQIEQMRLNETIANFGGFDESFEFEHFKTFFCMNDQPGYTLLQCKDSEEFNTSSETWFLCLPKDGQMCVIDAGAEEEVCDQFFNLIELLKHGFGAAEIRPKITDNTPKRTVI
jgi:hypothetical protein